MDLANHIVVILWSVPCS